MKIYNKKQVVWEEDSQMCSFQPSLGARRQATKIPLLESEMKASQAFVERQQKARNERARMKQGHYVTGEGWTKAATKIRPFKLSVSNKASSKMESKMESDKFELNQNSTVNFVSVALPSRAHTCNTLELQNSEKEETIMKNPLTREESTHYVDNEEILAQIVALKRLNSRLLKEQKTEQ